MTHEFGPACEPSKAIRRAVTLRYAIGLVSGSGRR